VPASWDETKVLDGRIGEYVVIARRRGSDWFLGAITDAPRRLTIPLGFLGAGTFEATVYGDVPDSAKTPTRIAITPVKLGTTARAGGQITVDLVQSGGAAIRIRPAAAAGRR
jgi:alpha-glucosidase